MNHKANHSFLGLPWAQSGRIRWWAAILIWMTPWLARAADVAAGVDQEIARIELLLEQWQFETARADAEQLLDHHPDLPAVQLEAGWVKFHFGQAQEAVALVDRAAAVFGQKLESDSRLTMIRASARITLGFVREASPDGKVVVLRAEGPDEILVPYLFETVAKTLQVVGEDLGYRVPHPILVEILPDDQALAESTGLTAQEIGNSGTIAVCKYGRLLITSPRATLQGFHWLDTVSHELVHLIIAQKTLNRVPVWLHEALARFEDSRWRSQEPGYALALPPLAQSRLAAAVREKRLITFAQMSPSMALLPDQQSADLAFSEVFMAARFLHERLGYPGLQQLLDKIQKGASDVAAIQQVYGWDQASFNTAWVGWLGQQKWTLLDGEFDLIERKDQGGSPRAVEKILSGERRVEVRDFFHLGQVLRARSRNRAAVMEYQKAVSGAGPRYAAAWMLLDKLGLALLGMDRSEEARKAFEAALNTNPHDLEARIWLGRLYLETDPQAAWLHLQEALRINPLDPRVQSALLAAANQLHKRGEPDRDYAALRERYRRALAILAQRGKRVEEDLPATTPPAAEQEEGGSALRVLSYPWARVFLDYQDTGQSSPIYRLPVKPGLHWIGLLAPCSQRPLVLPVRVGPGETVVVDRRLCQEEEDGATTR